MKTVSNTAKNSGMWIRHWPAASTHPYFRTLNNDFFIWACHILFTVISKFYGDFELLALLYRSRKFQMGIWLTNIFFRLRDWFTGRYYQFLINISVSIVLYSSLSLASWKIFCISLKSYAFSSAISCFWWYVRLANNNKFSQGVLLSSRNVTLFIQHCFRLTCQNRFCRVWVIIRDWIRFRWMITTSMICCYRVKSVWVIWLEWYKKKM